MDGHTAPARPVLRYPGAKWRIAPWVLAHLPPHLVYVEPYAGSAAVLLQKPRARTEVYNDRDGDVVGLFRVLRDRPAELARALALTPYARDEYAAAYEPAQDPVEAARRLVARSFMGQNSKGIFERSGFDGRLNDDLFVSRLASMAALPEVVVAVAARLTHVLVENDDALAVMARYDRAEALHYVDPPYLLDTRAGRRRYPHEMTAADHAALLAALQGLRGMAVVSGYPSELYDRALAGWRRVERQARTDGGADRTEVLWINPAAEAALAAAGRAVASEQLTLEGMA